MLKNELSIKAQHSYDVAIKIVEHREKLIKQKTAESISHYKSLVSFKNSKSEAILFAKRKELLKDNIEALFTKNSLDAKAALLKNNKDYHRFNWSFVKIDRNNPNKEAVKKQIALNRHSTVIYDMNYETALFEAKWSNLEKENEINTKLEMDRLSKDVYLDKLPYEKTTYQDFYNGVVSKHNELVISCKEKLNELYPLVDEVIEYSYESSYGKEVRESILAVVKEIVSYYKELESLDIQLLYLDIDRQILDIQLKEGLKVNDEIEELVKNVDSIKLNKESIIKKIEEKSKKLNELLEQRKANKVSDFDLNVSVEDETVKSLLVEVKDSFKLPSNETFLNIYRVIKEYVLSLCPFFYDYLAEQEALYEKENEEYRKENVSSLPEELQKAFLSSKKEYLIKISSIGKDSDVVEKLVAEHLLRVQDINEQFTKDIEDLKHQKQLRKEEYLQQKESAKITLKTADGAKAAELRDVVKLYKKEINYGEFKRYYKVYKKKQKALKEEKELLNSLIIKETNPAPVSYEHDAKIKVADNKKLKAKERKDLNRTHNKDYTSSKYRKNLNTSKRENGLGYLFLSVWAIGFVIFTLVPILYTIVMFFSSVTYDNSGYSILFAFSFKEGIQFPNWVGVDNFETLILQDVNFTYTLIPQLFRSLLLFVPIVVFISFVLAMLLNSKIKGRTFFRIIYFLPVVIVSGPVLKLLNNSNTSGQSSIRLSLDGSSIAKILMSISPKALEYANEIFQNFIIILWMTGVPIVLFISALQKINRQLYEAAEIDGANKWQMLWTITYPLIKSVLLIVCLFTIMQVVTIDISFVNPINDWINGKLGTTNYNYGLIAVACWIQTLIVLLFVLGSFLLFREKEFVSKDKNFEEIEEAKRKKNQRRAKLIQTLKINEIKHFFATLFAPITRTLAAIKAKKEEEGE